MATLALLTTACGSSLGTQAAPKAVQPHPLPAAMPAAWGVSVPGAGPCNPLGGEQCMLPFPSNYYSTPDRSTASGVRVDFPAPAMPVNSHGVRIDPAPAKKRDIL